MMRWFSRRRPHRRTRTGPRPAGASPYFNCWKCWSYGGRWEEGHEPEESYEVLRRTAVLHLHEGEEQ